MNPFIDRTGEKHITNEGYNIEIIKCFGSLNCTISFMNGVIVSKKSYFQIKSGEIKNPYHPSVFGKGYIGVGEFKSTSSYKIYSCWQGMLERCYYEKYQLRSPTYKGCSVDEKWHNFQTFAKWYEENRKDYMDGWQLDKDILVKGNKSYSPETCCFVPRQVNTLLVKSNNRRGNCPIGVDKNRLKFRALLSSENNRHVGIYNTVEEAFQAYKTAKEEHIKNLAEKWKSQLSPQTYQALINYKVEIDD